MGRRRFCGFSCSAMAEGITEHASAARVRLAVAYRRARTADVPLEHGRASGLCSGAGKGLKPYCGFLSYSSSISPFPSTYVMNAN